MNERIKELADEAAKFSAIMALPTGESGDKLFVEKLAELIVREAAQFVSGSAEVYTQAEQDACVRAAIGLKKYFGIEDLQPCKSPYCECDVNKCSHPGFYDARGES